MTLDISNLNKSEIRYFDITIFIDHYILGLQVTIDQMQEMQILQGEKDLSGVKAGMLFIELAHSKGGKDHNLFM